MASMLEVLQDRTRYPDTLAWPLEDGSSMTLGQLRQEMMPRTDVQRIEQEANARLTALQREKATLERMITERAASVPDAGQQPASAQYDYNGDPLFKPLWDRAQKVDTLEQQLQKVSQINEQLVQAITYQLPAALKIQQLQGRDPALDPQKFVEFVKQHNYHPNQYDDAYRLMTYEQQVQKAKEEGIAAGKAEAEAAYKAAPQVPYAPYGPAQFGMPEPPKVYANEQEMLAAMMSDADVIGAWNGQ